MMFCRREHLLMVSLFPYISMIDYEYHAAAFKFTISSPTANAIGELSSNCTATVIGQFTLNVHEADDFDCLVRHFSGVLNVSTSSRAIVFEADRPQQRTSNSSITIVEVCRGEDLRGRCIKLGVSAVFNCVGWFDRSNMRQCAIGILQGTANACFGWLSPLLHTMGSRCCVPAMVTSSLTLWDIKIAQSACFRSGCIAGAHAIAINKSSLPVFCGMCRYAVLTSRTELTSLRDALDTISSIIFVGPVAASVRIASVLPQSTSQPAEVAITFEVCPNDIPYVLRSALGNEQDEHVIQRAMLNTLIVTANQLVDFVDLLRLRNPLNSSS